jgi:DNA-binding winged helix-turn-helix (wHTH) protein
VAIAAKSYRFGPYSVDIARREIHRGQTRLDVPAKVFDCVAYLIEHRDRAVGRDELISAVWGRVDVADNLLAQIVLRARRAFDDDAETQRHIRTITGFGYRWVYEFDNDVSAPAVPHPGAGPVAASPLPSAAPAAPPLSIRRLPWKRFAPALFSLVLLAIAVAALYIAKRQPHVAVPAPRPLVFVLPAIVHDASELAWVRLGVMDLVAQRLREAGQPTVPSDTVVALAKFAGETPTAAELANLTQATGARAFLQPDVRRENGRWRVGLTRLTDAKPANTYAATANDVVEATSAATAQLSAAFDLAPPPYKEGSGPGAALAQQVASALLQDRLADARTLIEGAPPDVRDDPRVRLQSAAIDFYQSRLAEARATLEKLRDERTPDRPPELNARVLIALAALENRGGNYAAGERIATQAIDSIQGLDTALVGDSLGSALMVRAVSRIAEGAYDKATDDFAAARVALTTTGNVRTLALVDSNSALMQMERDRFRDAVDGLTKSVDYFHLLGAPIRELLDRNKLAACHLALLDYAAAGAEDAKLAELAARVEDPEVRSDAHRRRAEIAFALGRTSDAESLVKELLSGSELSDVVRGPVLLLDSQLALAHGDLARAATSARTALGLKWAEDDPREYATTWLVLARADRKLAAEKSADDAARARAWASSSIYPSASLLIDLLEAEQLASRGQDNPARAAFERALRETSEREVPSDVVEVTTSYAAWLIDRHDLERALAVLGRNHAWAAASFAVAVSEARLYREQGTEKLWQAALDRARAAAGEREIPADLREFRPVKTVGDRPSAKSISERPAPQVPTPPSSERVANKSIQIPI